MSKKGFTLVEILGVVLLIGLIVAILIPNYNKSIEKGRRNSYKESMVGLIRSLDNYIMTNSGNYGDYKSVKSIELEGNNLNTIESGEFKYDSALGKIVLKNVTDGKYCATGTKEKITINEGNCN